MGALNGAVLYSFAGGGAGEYPQSRLTADAAGNLYGTTQDGGLGYGTVYELSPNGNVWNETVLYSFSGGVDGAYPGSSYVMFDNLGNLYGTTAQGGEFGYGVVFELSLAEGSWTETVLYNFTGGADGSNPENGLIMDSAGNLYGDNEKGIFELNHSEGVWTGEQVIYESAPSKVG